MTLNKHVYFIGVKQMVIDHKQKQDNVTWVSLTNDTTVDNIAASDK